MKKQFLIYGKNVTFHRKNQIRKANINKVKGLNSYNNVNELNLT